MIKVNLLPFRAARKKENIRRQISIACLGFILVGAGLFYFHLHLNSKIAGLTTHIEQTQKTLATYKKITEEIDEIKRKLETLNKMLEVIATLETNRKEPLRLLDQMTQVIIKKRMWFTRMEAKGGSVRIVGNALDNQTIADFMTNLEGTGMFTSVNLESIQQRQAPQAGIVFKEFQVVCSKFVPKAPENAQKNRKRPAFLRKK